VFDEFVAVAKQGLDDQARVFEQLNHYLIDCPQVLQQRPFWSAILLRDHGNPLVRSALEVWAAHVSRYSRRDQLSANAAFTQLGLVPDVFEIDNNSSWFHTWPHDRDRVRERDVHVGSAPPPLAAADRARLAQALALQQTLGARARQDALFLNSNAGKTAVRLAVKFQGLWRAIQAVLAAPSTIWRKWTAG
jgi:hypothetical protein